MKRTRNDDLINSLVGDFYTKVGIQKTAGDDKEKNSPQGQTSGPAQGGAWDAEKKADLKGMVQDGAILATEESAKVKGSDVMADAPNQIARLGSDDAPKGEDKFKVEENKNIAASSSEVAKVARAERLSMSILGTIQALGAQQAPLVQKTAAQMSPQDQEAMNAFAEFSAGFNRGIQKKAEDVQEVTDSGVVPSAKDAESLLNTVAVQNPEAVLPEEAQPEAQLDPETTQALDQLAQAMAQEGVKPEDLAEAAGVVQELQAKGVQPDQIVQAVDQMAAGQEKQAAEQKVNFAVERITNFLKGN